MTCETTRAELLGFHFGASEAREAVEAHLLGCRACVAEFLALKRDVELGALEAPRPRAQARASVRAAIAAELGVGPAPAPWWSARPFAFAFAAAAVLVAMASVQALSTAAPVAPVGVTPQR